MPTLFHLPLSASCRAVRLALAEKQIASEFKVELVWERRPEFLALNPAGQVPVLIDGETHPVCGLMPVLEFLEETVPEPSLNPGTAGDRAEARRLVEWFEQKFGPEVGDNLVGEKLLKRFLRRAQPNSDAIRAGLKNIHYHMQYISWLADRRKWLAGDQMSFADLVAAAHLSTVDYLGDVPWNDHPVAKDWYARIKSRPAFRTLLSDNIPGVPPPRHYADLDF